MGESHYWGHNAIIRVKPFIEHCALALLPGTGSFAGAILSHDFVEAALMRRAGWGVWIATICRAVTKSCRPTCSTSSSATVAGAMATLMNFRLFMVRGVHTVHRLVFL